MDLGEEGKINDFERFLKVYTWVDLKDASLIREMHQTDNFKGKHEQAAASYLIWLNRSYPKVTPENREAQRQQHLKNLYKIFRNHCPDHDIFNFIDDEQE